MTWYNPATWFQPRNDSTIQDRDITPAAQQLQQRAYEPLAEKVFIEREGLDYEWSLQEPGGNLIGQRFYDLFYGFYGRQNFIQLFYGVPEVFAPVHEIAKRVSDATFQLRKDWNDEVDLGNESFNRLFESPNPLISFKDLIYQSVCYEILVGKNFWYINKPDVLPDEFQYVLGWWCLPAQDVVAKEKRGFDPYSATSMDDFIDGYTSPLPYGGGTRFFPTHKIIPLLNLSLRSGILVNDCLPPIMGAEKAIRNLIPVYEARGTIYIKRGALGFVVSKKGDESGLIALTPKEKVQLDKDFEQTFGVTGGKSPINTTSLPVEFVRTAMSIQELQPFEETLSDAIAIYKVLRVPRHLVPSKDTSTFANADADLKSFYTDVIIPWAKRYCQTWNNYFKLKDIRRYIFPDFSHIDVLQENRKEKSEVDKTYGDVWLQRWQNGGCTLNEWITAVEGTPGTGPIYDKKVFELSKDEISAMADVVNLFKRGVDPNAPAAAAAGGTPQPSKNGKQPASQN